MLFMIGLVADVVSFNRRLIEETLYRVRKTELALTSGQKNEGCCQGRNNAEEKVCG
jgi:hypothetical protein